MPRFEKWLIGVAPTAPVDQVARRALTARLRAVSHYLDTALSGPDEADGVHQLRVWTRRSEAALQLFRRAIPHPERQRMRRLLRKLRRKAGALRDCDVHFERLKSQDEQPPQRVFKSLKDQRRLARRKLQKLRRKLRHDERLQTQAEKLLAGIAWPKRHSSRAAPGFGPWCRQELTPLAARFFELAESNLADNETLHALRIAGKRLRYALELSVAALRPRAGRQLYDKLSALQDRLGEVCDDLAASEHVRAWLKEAKKSQGTGKLRTLLAGAEQRLITARSKFLRWWSAARRARLQRRWNAAM